MKRRLPFYPACLAIVCFALCGCASVFTAGTWGSGPRPPYAGSGAEAAAVAETIRNPPPLKEITAAKVVTGMLVLIDLPLSAAVDTLLLPVCLVDNIQYRNRESQKKRTDEAARRTSVKTNGPVDAERTESPNVDALRPSDTSVRLDNE